MKNNLLCLCFTVCSFAAFSQSNIDSSRLNDLFRLYRESFVKKDFTTAKKYLDTALMIVPDLPSVRYAHARIALRNGMKEEAMNDIGYLIKQRALSVKVAATDSMIKAEIGNDPRFGSYQKSIANFDNAINSSVVAFEVPDKMLLPEGITNDPLTKIIYLGSMYQRKVITIDKNGVIKDFIQSKQDDVLGVLGMAIDAKRRILYLCCGYLRQAILDTNDIKDKRTAVYAYDLTTRKLLQKYRHDKAVFFNDLDVAPNGDVYVTDSEGNKVYRINKEKNVMELFIERPFLQSPNGIVFNNSGDLFIAAYLGGILKVNMRTGAKIWITKPDTISLAGNDGMEWYENSLIINSPVEHKAIRRLYLNKDQTAIIKEEILAYDPTIIAECTTGTVLNNEFYFIGNSGLDAYERNGSLNAEKLKNPVIRKVKLK